METRRGRRRSFRVLRRSYAVSAGKSLADSLPLDGGPYHVPVDGPNGFMREFKGIASYPGLDVQVGYPKGWSGKPDGRVELSITNNTDRDLTMVTADPAYGAKPLIQSIAARGHATVIVETVKSSGWYDFRVYAADSESFCRCAGRVETGLWGRTDPAMG